MVMESYKQPEIILAIIGYNGIAKDISTQASPIVDYKQQLV